jgi:hypothetical protein
MEVGRRKKEEAIIARVSAIKNVSFTSKLFPWQQTFGPVPQQIKLGVEQV